ncbi:CAF17-like 4Fe-4S cluster assembly/insertion protein YgfZ [Corynebacterium epidermidicanis]|uniref:Folate-binding protein n=1 Tax=Corynebacterium epidermidicanis TaxID=1050174 RepID=A0A0G3GTN4_9CORY|nr:folate-binding protein YgfZ [Corynebacterium epidermidicanis]AKK03910.1 folate-binding protein [Corynebacterium epidermidicanis]
MATTYRSPLLDHPGAAELQDESTLVDARGVAWHYGAPLQEQQLLSSTTGIVDRSHRVIFLVSGEDAATFLNNLLSQKLDDAQPGLSTSALDLDVQGHIAHHLDIAVTRVGFYLDVPAGQADSLQDYLNKMVFWSQVTIERTDLALLTLLGDPLDCPNAHFVRGVDWSQLRRTDLAVPRAELVATVTQLEAAGGKLVGLMAFTAERVKAWEPELFADLDNRSIPHESSFLLTHAVHLNKGCYRGQETVSRVHNLGRAPRALVQVHLDGSVPQLPTAGAEIIANGRVIGRLGTIVDDCDYGPSALALIKRSALDATALQTGDCALTIEKASLPQDDGERPGRSAINRLRGM